MRILTLDLRAWGHFAGRSLEFPNEQTVHLVIGPNQAGKSTARRGFLSILKGMDGEDSLPVALPGAELRAKVLVDGQEHDVQRLGRIERGRAWLGANGRPLTDTEGWMPITRDVYAAVFCLDREGLDRSGRELARSDGELGSLFFAAGIGADILAKTRETLEARTTKLFSPNANGKTKEINAASDRLLRAIEAQRSHEVVDMVARTAAANAATTRTDDLAAQRRRLDAQVTELTSARAAVPQVDAVRDAEAALASVRGQGPLPDQAWVERAGREVASLESAEQALREAEEALERAREELSTLPEDTEVLAHATAIDDLRSRTALVDGAARDLPALTFARASAEAALAAAARAAGQSTEVLGSAALDTLRLTMPTPETIATARQTLAGRAGLEDRVRQAKDSLAAAESTLGSAVKDRDAGSPLGDVRAIREALESARALGDIERDVGDRTADVTRRRARAAAEFERLRIARCEARFFRALPLPSAELVAAEVAEADDCEARRERAAREVEAANIEIRSAEARIREIRATGRAPDLETLNARRGERNAGIEAFIEAQAGRPGPLGAWSPTPGPALRAAVKVADDVADERFGSAEAVTQLALMEATLVSARVRLGDAEAAGTLAAAREAAALERWGRLLAERGLPNVNVREAGRWATDALSLGDALSDLEAAEAILAERVGAKARAEALLSAALGDDGAGAPSWAALIGRADVRVREHEVAKQARANLVGRIEAAETSVEAGERDVARHQRALDAWATEWAALPRALGLPDGSPPAAGDQRVAAWVHLGAALSDFDTADRAWKGAADIVAEFEASVQEVRALADERLPSRVALDAMVNRLQAALLRNQERGVVSGRISGQEQQIQRKTSAAGRARASLEALRAEAGLSPGAELQPVFDRVAQATALGTRLADLRRALPGKLEALEALIAGRAADSLADALDLVAAQRAAADAEWQPALEQRVKAQQRLDEVSGLDTAAQDAERCAALGAELAARVEEYLEEAAAAWLLEQAIQEMADKASDGPLRRASECFAELTDGAFDGLVAWTEGEGGKAVQYVCARRPNGERLSPDQLSDGTRDHLWLALRIAVIEHHLDRGIVAPVVFDDVLVNMDDTWAAALFRVLRTLAQRTQVVMFTHHQHLEDVARATLGDDGLSVGRLAPRDPALPRTGSTPVAPVKRGRPLRLPVPPEAGGARDTGNERAGDEHTGYEHTGYPHPDAATSGDATAVLGYIAAHPGARRGEVTAALGISDARWTVAIAALRSSNQVRQEGAKKGTCYFATRDET
jgi:uncharacterized protein YhaN